MNEQVITQYYNDMQCELRQSQQCNINECLCFTGIDNIIVEEPFI